MVFDTFWDPWKQVCSESGIIWTGKVGILAKEGSKRVSKWVKKGVKRVEKPIFSRARGDSLTFPQWFVLGSSVCVLTIAYNRKMFWDRFWPFFDQKMVQKWGVYPPNGSVPRGSKKRPKRGSLLRRLKEGFRYIWGQKGGPKRGSKMTQNVSYFDILGFKKVVPKSDRLDRLDFLEFGVPKNVTFGTLFEPPWIRPVLTGII